MRSLKDISKILRHDFGKQEAKMIIEHVTGLTESDFISKPDTSINDAQRKQIDNIIERRVAGEPLTRILGIREFWGLEFEVTPDVLDPRPDTETLVEAVLKKTQKDPSLKILDLGTGTGCIPISLLTELPQASGVAADVSEKALEVARRNAEKNGVLDRMEFIQSDWFENLGGQQFDLIVSNPPYISDQVIPNLDDEVKNHDPILALSGGESGLDCYKIIFSQLNDYLLPEARAFFEIGFDQLSSITRLAGDSHLRLVAAYKDLGGHDRVVEIMRGDK